MDRKSPIGAPRIPKYKIPVRIRFADDSSLVGVVFIRQGQRVLDLMCDERQFIPVVMTAGTTLANKAHVRQVDVLGLPEIVDIQDALPEFDLAYIQNNAS